MWNIFKVELYRSFKNKLFLLSFILSSTLVIWYSLDRLPFTVERNATFPIEVVVADFLELSFTNWIGSHNMFVQQNIFYMLIPFIATIPFGSSFFSDINSGYMKNICVRTSRKKYLLAKYFSVFISGGCAAIAPMILSFMISAAFLPTMLPEASYACTNYSARYKWTGLFFEHPFAYILLYIGIVFIFGGLIACMSLTISYFSAKSFLPLLFPFFIYIFSSLFFELLNLNGYSIRNFLTTTEEYGTTFSVLIMALVFFVLSFFPYYFIGVKRDVM